MGRPWSWVCEDAELAGAVGEVLRSLGAMKPEGVGEEENEVAGKEWRRFLGKLHNQLRMGEFAQG